MFSFGLARISRANYFSINGASTTAAASAANVLAAWAHAEINIDHSAKTVSYKITSMDGATTYYTADNVAFVDPSAAYCNQIDFFDCQNNAVSYLDNLVITKYVDQSKVATTYTVKYQNAAGTDVKDAATYDTYVGDTFTASTADMATFFNGDESKKYVYASGNESKEASATASENVITLVFNEYDKVSYTVTAKDGENTLGTLASGDAYTDGSTTAYWHKYMDIDGQWYETTGNYGKAINEAGNTDVAYIVSDVVYFVESENINKSRSAAANARGIQYSGGESQRHYTGSQWWTEEFADGGCFKVYFPYSMANASASTLVIKTRDSEGAFTETGLTLTANSPGSFSGIVTIPAGSSLAICNDTQYNSNILIDYVTLTPATETKTISAAGYATYCSANALDFTNVEGLTAYVAKVSGSDVTFEAVTKVPAKTGVLLKGAAGEYQIPVVADGGSATSALVGVLEAKEVEAPIYVLMNGDEGVGFYKTTTTFTVGANTAYLPAQTAGTARSFIGFDGESSTGISSVENSELRTESCFDLQGRRVAQPTKGLYIMNGKKTVVR